MTGDNGLGMAVIVHWIARRVLAAVVGNGGKLQGRIPLLPDADPTDGVLDLALLGAGDARSWLATTRRLMRSRRIDGAPVERFQFRRLEPRCVRARPFEADGEACGRSRSLRVRVNRSALAVRVPR